MSIEEARNLAAWSRAVRESSLKRLHRVPEGRESWRPIAEAMSFADLARHLIDADEWLITKLEIRALEPMVGCAGIAGEVTRAGYLALLSRLEETGRQRAELIEELSSEQLAEPIFDRRFGGEVTLWWVIVRGNLDHEVHHRGQLATYLRLAGIAG
ncbi:MAG TPA: DinB family protein [Thermoanaerobaculia bacterium]|jgi:uncharacterized damage-inducible protein DinB|nr:DinB family protein [Thermoanaerobaculia bacterium]